LTKNLTVYIIFTLLVLCLCAVDALPIDSSSSYDSDAPRLSRPTFIFDGGTYFDYVTIDFQLPEPDVCIRYTTDGSTPDENSPVFITPFRLKTNATISARAYKQGWLPSDTTSQYFSLQNVPQIDSISFQENSLNITWQPIKDIINYEWILNNIDDIESQDPSEPINVYEKRLVSPGNKVIQRMTIIDPDIDLLKKNIRYTIYIASDTSNTDFQSAHTAVTPFMTSIPITEPGFYQIYIQASCELISETNLTNSSQIHTIEIKQVSDVTITPEPGLYYDTLRVQLSHPTADIYYTTDGSTPDDTSRRYTAPILLNKHTLTDIKYRAYIDGYLPSDIFTARFHITDTVSKPNFSHPSGLYNQPFYLTLYCDVENSLIFYTTDGSEPSRNSQIYVTPLLIDRTMTIKAEGTLHYWKRSGVVTEEYGILTNNQNSNTPSNVFETRLLKAQLHPTELITNISFILKNDSYVEVMIYNLLEQKVVTLISTILKRGEHNISWDGKNSFGEPVSSGVYFCYFKTGDHFEVMKIIHPG